MKKIGTFLLVFGTCFGLSANMAAAAQRQDVIDFDLYSTIYNYGESINKVVLDTTELDIDEGCLTADMFQVQAKGKEHMIMGAAVRMVEEDGLKHYGTYDEAREVKDIYVEDGKLVLDLVTQKNTPGKSTLDFTANFETKKGCNLSLDVSYDITLTKPLKLKDGTQIEAASFKQGEIINEEVRKFAPGRYLDVKYQLYTPSNANDGRRHPLIVWFHGGGESGYRGVLYNNSSQMKANRGAVAFAGSDAQEIFGGAYVLAPQVPNEWSDSLEEMKDLIDWVVKNNSVDTDRIYVYGCSAGGYMTLDMAVKNPGFFAAAVAVCPAIDQANIDTYGEGRRISDEELLSLKDTPLWLVQAKNDGTVKFEESALRVFNLLKDHNAILTAYDSVNVDGDEYSGHEAWVYTALNMPEHNGEHLWQWSARQKLN